jgi:uncharacterized protein YutE (UPF0331/DUF86 family)
MSKLVFNKIVAKLERLDEYLHNLRDIQKTQKKIFLNDYHFYGLAERYLQLAIEVLLDTSKLVIISEKLRKPEDNQDIFVVLNENKIISPRLSERLVGIANFRNILVHDYEKIDREIVYKKLRNNIADFTDFKKEILRFLRLKK